MYSQNNEEQTILQYFGLQPTGRFLDIGCHDGIHLSNTRALADKGWSGVLVDPSPISFTRLMDNYSDSDRNKFKLIHAAIVPGDPEPMVFYDATGDPLSTSAADTLYKWPSTKFIEIVISTMNINTLFNLYQEKNLKLKIPIITLAPIEQIT